MYSPFSPNVFNLFASFVRLDHSLLRLDISLSKIWDVAFTLCSKLEYWCPFISSTACASNLGSPFPIPFNLSNSSFSLVPTPSTPYLFSNPSIKLYVSWSFANDVYGIFTKYTDLKVSSEFCVPVAIQVKLDEAIPNFFPPPTLNLATTSLYGFKILVPTWIFLLFVYLDASVPNIKLTFFNDVNFSIPFIGLV